jgi:hypothetical protein
MLGVALLAGVLLTGQHPARVQAQAPDPVATVQPASLRANLCEQQCLTETITIQLHPRDESVIDAMDVVFLLDISSSMDDVLSTVTSESSNIAEGLRTLITDTRFAVGVFSDYDDVPWNLPVNFTSELGTLNRGLRGIRLERGGDTRESYTRALWEVGQLGWRDEAVKIVVLFTDAPPHRTDRGRDGRTGTSDDLTYRTVLSGLKDMGVRVIGIDSGSAGAELREAGTATDGAYFVLSRVSDIPSQVITSISDELAELRLSFYVEDNAQDGWYTQLPANFAYPDDGNPVQVTISFCPAEHNLPRGTYTSNLMLMEATTSFVTIPSTITYSPVCNALLIPDTATDTGEDCTAAPFWQSPAIIIRYTADGGTTSQPVRAGYPHSVYVSVKNNGFENANAVSVTLREADGLLSEIWTDIGQQMTDIPIGQTVLIGPFDWTPTSSTVALGATAESAAVPLTDEPYYCASQHAQRRETVLPLDNFTLNPPLPTGLLDIAGLRVEGNLSVSTGGVSDGGFVGWVSPNTEERADSGRTLTIRSSDNATKLVFSTDIARRFGLGVTRGSDTVQGADVIVEPAQRTLSSNGTVLTEYKPTFTPPNELLIPIILILGLGIVIAFVRTRSIKPK